MVALFRYLSADHAVKVKLHGVSGVWPELPLHLVGNR